MSSNEPSKDEAELYRGKPEAEGHSFKGYANEEAPAEDEVGTRSNSDDDDAAEGES